MAVLTPTSEEARVYEVCILYPYPFSKNDEKKLLEEMEGFFKEVDATIHVKDLWGRRGLAFPIGGSREGNFAVFYIEIPPAKVKELDEALRIHTTVLRHLIIRPPNHYEVRPYAERYKEWQKEQAQEEQRAKEEKEEHLKKQALERTRKKAERAEKRKKEERKKEGIKKEELTERIDEIISDQDLDL